MNKNYESRIFMVGCYFFWVAIMFFFFGFMVGRGCVHNKAVEEGAAEWIINENGLKVIKWKK